jgi:predicted nuclease of restriction endonuclease-like (RecB) superfamily
MSNPDNKIPTSLPKGLLEDVVGIIQDARMNVSRAVNSGHVVAYWNVGNRIRKDILKKSRAEYGKQIVSTLSRQLIDIFGQGFSRPNLFKMINFAAVFEDFNIVSTLSRQLSWSHFQELFPLDDPLKRQFYCEMCRLEKWNIRTLREKIAGMLFERTALSKKPEKLIKQELELLSKENVVTPDLVFRDPYFLDFLGLKDTYAEKDLEAAILREMESFILELGVGFSFVARQKRMTVDGEDYYLDLLFYNRKLHRLIAIDLKLGKFTAQDKGQMELYLRWLEKYELELGEQPPIGLILCAGKSDDHVELLQLSKSGIRVATYLTELPPKKVLERQLHEAIARNRARIESKGKLLSL